MPRLVCCLLVMVAALVILGAGHTAVAYQPKVLVKQPAAQPAYSTFPAVSGFYMLRMKHVQEQLELVPEQIEKLEKIGKEYYQQMREDWSGMADMSVEERRKKTQEIREKQQKRAEEVAEKIKGVLLDHQLKKLEEINFQSRAPSMLRSPQTIQKLNLTEEQKDKLKKAQEELQKKMRELQEEALKEALKVLTEEQKKELRKMTAPGYQWGTGGVRRGGAQ